MNIVKLLTVAGVVVAANWAADNWVLRVDASDRTGFIQVEPGLGLDDLARGLTIATSLWVAHKFLNIG